jgi:DNA polymerase V
MPVKKNKKEPSLDFFTADLNSGNEVPITETGIHAGFPSPAEDFIEMKLDLNKELVKNSNSTFYGRVRGNSMKDAGISDGDILVIDKSLEPRNNKIAVCFIDGEFIVKRIRIVKGEVYLVPANSEFKPIHIIEENSFMVWGIVTYVIHKH